MAAVKINNNAASRLASSLTAGAATLSVNPGEGARFPAPTAGDWFPVTLLKSSGQLEIVRCTARSGDVLTVTRGQEGTVAIQFDAGDRVELRATAAVFAELQTKTAAAQSAAEEAQADIDAFDDIVQNGQLTRIGSIAGSNTITGTVPDPFTTYVNGQKFDFIAAADNTGAVTISLNGLGAKAVTKQGTTALRPGDIRAGAVVQIAYDGTRFQIVSGASNGGATGGGLDQVFYENGQTITEDYTVGPNKNAGTFGPVAIADGKTVTVEDGCTWSIV